MGFFLGYLSKNTYLCLENLDSDLCKIQTFYINSFHVP